ncbi:UNVERIFIED_CONTAM: hypothetical protein RMT77_016482 [Armadillidium vulgare]
MFNNSLPKLLKVIITVIVAITLASRLRCDKTSKGRVSSLSDAATGEEFSEVIQRRSRSVKKPPRKDWAVGHLPEVPESLSAARDTSKFLDLWEYRLNIMEEGLKKPLPKEPNIIIIMTSKEMMKLIPDEKLNPLYLPKYGKDAANFILDSLCAEKVLWNPENLHSRKGHLHTTMNGKTLIFKQNRYTDEITINGVKALSREVRPDRKEVFILNNYLFGYEKIIKKALKDFESSGGGDINVNRMLIGKLCFTSFPEIPKFAASEVVRPSNSFVGEDKTSVGVKKTSVSVDKTSVGEDKTSVGEDKTSVGEDKTSVDEDKTSVGVNKASVGADKTSIGADKASVGADKAFVGKDKTSVGADKTSVGADKASIGADKFLHVWEYHVTLTKSKKRDNSTCQFAPEYEVSTIVAVDNEKMMSSLPYKESENPLYLTDYEELTDHFILDSISADAVDVNDTNLFNPEGISIHALSGVHLTFRKDNSSGILSVNGETVLKMKTGENGRSIFVIDNFLFTHLEDTVYAHTLLLREEATNSTI